MARTRSEDYDVKRRLILDQAAALFAEKGFSAASLSELARACEGSKSWIYHYYPSKEAILYDILSDHMTTLLETAERELANLIERVPEADKAGVKIVLGDDYGTILLPHGTYADELAFYVKRFGIAPLDVIRWATVHGAKLMGMGNELGTVEAGKLADLLVVDGDPSVDITLLTDAANIKAILKGGDFVKDELSH